MKRRIKNKQINYNFFKSDIDQVCCHLGQDRLLDLLQKMLLIRNFEVRAESAYQHSKVGGFFHAYIGQEAIQTAAVAAMGQEPWWITSYRCHALALLLGATPDELMAELYGKALGNAKGRGGSMHFFADKMLGGFGVVAGQVPVAAGAAFSIKYLEQRNVAVCFMGDGAVAQGVFHETLNMASLWDLPLILVIENNNWGMGTAVELAVCLEPIAETRAPAYGIKGYTFDGMDLFNCYAGFKHVHQEVLGHSRPVLVEVVTERFRGHSISDPGLYRLKEELDACMERDPINLVVNELKNRKMLTEQAYEELNRRQKEVVIAAMKYAEQSPFPDPITLGEGVFAPEDGYSCRS